MAALSGSQLAEIQGCLREKGIMVNSSWLKGAVEYIGCSTSYIPDIKSWTEKIYSLFIDCDIYESCCLNSVIPAGVEDAHKQQFLPGRTVILQIDEILNVGTLDENRDENMTGASRLLKLLLSDGRRTIVGVEIAPIPKLLTTSPAGGKIAVKDALIRRGMLILRPQCSQYLGGEVSRLSSLQQQYSSGMQQQATIESKSNEGHPATGGTGNGMVNVNLSAQPPPGIATTSTSTDQHSAFRLGAEPAGSELGHLSKRGITARVIEPIQHQVPTISSASYLVNAGGLVPRVAGIIGAFTDNTDSGHIRQQSPKAAVLNAEFIDLSRSTPSPQHFSVQATTTDSFSVLKTPSLNVFTKHLGQSAEQRTSPFPAFIDPQLHGSTPQPHVTYPAQQETQAMDIDVYDIVEDSYFTAPIDDDRVDDNGDEHNFDSAQNDESINPTHASKYHKPQHIEDASFTRNENEQLSPFVTSSRLHIDKPSTSQSSSLSSSKSLTALIGKTLSSSGLSNETDSNGEPFSSRIGTMDIHGQQVGADSRKPHFSESPILRGSQEQFVLSNQSGSNSLFSADYSASHIPNEDVAKTMARGGFGVIEIYDDDEGDDGIPMPPTMTELNDMEADSSIEVIEDRRVSTGTASLDNSTADAFVSPPFWRLADIERILMGQSPVPPLSHSVQRNAEGKLSFRVKAFTDAVSHFKVRTVANASSIGPPQHQVFEIKIYLNDSFNTIKNVLLANPVAEAFLQETAAEYSKKKSSAYKRVLINKLVHLQGLFWISAEISVRETEVELDWTIVADDSSSSVASVGYEILAYLQS